MWSILLYGCETWTITAETKKNLEATEMWFYMRMLRTSWKVKRTNESILEETNQERFPHKHNKEKATEIFRTHNYVVIRDWNFYLSQAR